MVIGRKKVHVHITTCTRGLGQLNVLHGVNIIWYTYVMTIDVGESEGSNGEGQVATPVHFFSHKVCTELM